MNKKLFACLAFLLLLCSSAFAQPRLWAVHNTMVDLDSQGERTETILPADLTTARFFCLTLEAVDDEDMPELVDINLYDRTTIPKMTITGGKYSYWNGDGIKTVDGTVEAFDIARSDTVMPENQDLIIGYDKEGYTPTNDGGDWIHFFGSADKSLNGVTVSWEAEDSSKIGSGTVPNFKSTSEQLEGIMPYIEYIWDDSHSGVKGFNWRFVRSNDVATAITAEEDMTITLRFTGGGYDWGNVNLLKDSDTAPIVKRKGEVLEGTVELTEYTWPHNTIIRYYFNDKEEECYQWRFMWRWGSRADNGPTPPEFRPVYFITVPIIDGVVDYKYARYDLTDLKLAVVNEINEPQYYGIGTMTIKDGDYALSNRNMNIDSKNIYLINTALMGNTTEYYTMTKEFYRPVGFNYLGQRYSTRQINLLDADGELNGKEVTWTFPEEISYLNGRAIMPNFMPLNKQLSPEGFFPYIEFVSEDNYLTAIKYRLVQSPDVNTPYKPADSLCLIELGLGTPDEYISYGKIYGASEDIKRAYDNDTWVLENPVKFDEFGFSVWLYVYPDIKDWETWEKNVFDVGNITDIKICTTYGWAFVNDFPISQLNLINDDELNELSGNIAETLSEDNEIFAVQREEVGDESDVIDDVEEIISDDNAELVGRFKQLNIVEDGTYAVEVTLPDELYDEIEGAGSADLVVYPITNSDIGEASGDFVYSSGMTLRTSKVFASSSNKSVSGRLLTTEGKAFDTVDSKKFILTANLKKAPDEYFTNYSLFLGLKTPASKTPEEIADDISEGDNPEDESATSGDHTGEEPGSNEDKPEETSDEETESESELVEAIKKVVAEIQSQKIESEVQTKLVLIISSDTYEVKTLLDIANSGDITSYDKNVTPNTRTVEVISNDFEAFNLSAVLPAFNLSIDKPVILILKITTEAANNLPLHLFKMKGSEVGGASVKYVKFSSTPDTGEDKDAVFYDSEGNIIKTLSSNPVYVSAVFDKGSYAPLIVTGKTKEASSSPSASSPSDGKEGTETSGNVSGSSSSGCNAGLLGVGALMILTFLLKRR